MLKHGTYFIHNASIEGWFWNVPDVVAIVKKMEKTKAIFWKIYSDDRPFGYIWVSVDELIIYLMQMRAKCQPAPNGCRHKFD